MEASAQDQCTGATAGRAGWFLVSYHCDWHQTPCRLLNILILCSSPTVAKPESKHGKIHIRVVGTYHTADKEGNDSQGRGFGFAYSLLCFCLFCC